MRHFRNILLIAEGQHQDIAFFDRVLSLAKANQARLTVLDVLKNLPGKPRMQISAINPQELENLAIEQRLAELAKLVGSLRTEGFQIDTKVLTGTPFLEIIREVLRNGHDLVIKTAQGGSGSRTMVFGSTDLHLLRKCPCPVWIGKPGQSDHHNHILAAVDPDPVNPERNSLNLKIMELASGLAKLEGSELHVVHVWNFYGEALLRGFRSTLSDTEVDQLVGITFNNHLTGLQGLLDKCDLQGIKLNKHLLRGEAGEIIPALAREKQIDLIVMGTIARTGIPGFFIGNTAEEVFDQVSCSVVALKPDGFVTPVTLKA